MYCPVCFNDTLKIASSGVVKVTFNGKSKSTSQFYYNLLQERPLELSNKFRAVVADYFQWYSTFQNKDFIKTITLTSHDFICTNHCSLSVEYKLSVVDLVLTKENIREIAHSEAKRFNIPLASKLDW